MNQRRIYYQNLFIEYPDLVTQDQLRAMLNGVSLAFTKRLIHEHKVYSFFIKPSYYITKKSVIEYLLTDDYQNRRLKAKV